MSYENTAAPPRQVAYLCVGVVYAIGVVLIGSNKSRGRPGRRTDNGKPGDHRCTLDDLKS